MRLRILLLVFCGLMLVSCRQDSADDPPPSERPDRSILVHMASDSLFQSFCNPASSTSLGYVTVVDTLGHSVAHTPISLGLTYPGGRVENFDASRGDSTNEYGSFYFRAVSAAPVPGSDTLIIRCGEAVQTVPLTVARTDPQQLKVFLASEYNQMVTADPSRDSLALWICFTNISAGADRVFCYAASDPAAGPGTFRPFPPTDTINGCTSAYWIPGQYGRLVLYAQIDGVVKDSTLIHVDSLP
jgi:hypothetical protein